MDARNGRYPSCKSQLKPTICKQNWYNHKNNSQMDTHMNSVQTIILFLSSIGLISCTNLKNEHSSISATVPIIVHTTTAIPEATFTPIQTPTDTSLSKESSYATPQPTPCTPFCIGTESLSTPLPSPEDYQLKTWTEEDAMNVLSVLDTRWEQFNKQNDYWIYGMMAVNQKRRYTALVAKEAVWRFPDNVFLDTLNWQIAHDLAVAGDTRASDWITKLLIEELNQQGNIQELNVSIMRENGFTSEIISVHNLFGDNLQSWILKVGKQYDNMPLTQWDGAIFAIKQSYGGEFYVTQVDNFWMPWHGRTYEVTAFDHTADHYSEIVVANEIKAGSGSGFTAANLCIYQWNDDQWKPVLSNNTNKPCFHFPSTLGLWEFLPTVENSPDMLEIISFVKGDCYWKKHHYYSWENNEYKLADIYIEIPHELEDKYGSEMFCMEDVWEWVVEEEEFSDIITLMEHILDDWSEIEENISQTWYGDVIGFDLAYKDYFRFQLGRFYALSGDVEQAQKVLISVVESPNDTKDPHWPRLAQEYLINLNDLQSAEQNLKESIASNDSNAYRVSETIWAGVITKEAEDALFSDGNPQDVISFLQNALSNPDLSCYDEPCAHLYYLLGLAYEVMGDEENAIANYWFLWNEFPESSHAIIVQNKLESLP